MGVCGVFVLRLVRGSGVAVPQEAVDYWTFGVCEGGFRVGPVRAVTGGGCLGDGWCQRSS